MNIEHTKFQPITKHELEAIFIKRVSQNAYTPAKRIQQKEISVKVSGIQSGTRYSTALLAPIIFDECIFNESIEIRDTVADGEVTFIDCIFNFPVKIFLNNSGFQGNCVFNSDVTIQSNKKVNTEFAGYNVKGVFMFIGETGVLVLKNINQNQPIEEQSININVNCSGLIVQGVGAKSIKFSDGRALNGEITCSEINVSEFIMGIFSLNSEMSISNSKIDELQVQKVIGDIRSLKIAESRIGKVELPMNALFKTSFIRSSIESLILIDQNEKDSILNIEKTTIKKLQFERVINNGLISMKELNIPIDGLIAFKSSNLGKADFIYCDFSKAILDFENSKITEAFFSETEFPRTVLVDGQVNHGQAQLTFGQLATAFQKQGDNIRTLEFNSRELDAHYKTISWFSSRFFQKVSLWLNAVSNNFGRDWFRATIFSLGVGFVFFCLLLISTNMYRWGFPSFDSRMLPAYLKFMNPLRFFELEAMFNNTPAQEKIKLTELSYLADFGGRIFIAYGYYQTIQAFRRFGRK